MHSRRPVCAACYAAIPIVGRPLRIVFTRASVVSKSGSRPVCEPVVLLTTCYPELPKRERQLQGIAMAKAAGVYKGRPPSIKPPRCARRCARSFRTCGNCHPAAPRRSVFDSPGRRISGRRVGRSNGLGCVFHLAGVLIKCDIPSLRCAVRKFEAAEACDGERSH
jgi:hypothetical protein